MDKRTVDSTVDSVLDDARRRSTIIDPTVIQATHSDSRFLLKTADANFQLHPWLQFQFRGVSNFCHDGKQAGTSDDEENGFEVRRLKFGIDGIAFNPNTTYLVQTAIDRNSGNLQLEQAWVKYHFESSPFALRFGQIKDPLDHEQQQPSKTFALIERTFIDDVFAKGENFVKGVSLVYEPTHDEPLRGEVAFHDGMRDYNQNFQDYPTNTADRGTAGRVDYKLFGRWKDYDKLTGEGTTEQTFVVGAGADYTEDGDTATLVHVVDAVYTNPQGVMLYGAYLGRYTKDFTTAAGATTDTYDPTLRGLVSYAIDPHWEPYAEYNYVHFDDDEVTGGHQSVHVITGGTSYYIYGHNLKLQVDMNYLPNGSPVSDSGSGILQDNHSNELFLSTQFQLLL